MNTLNHPLHDCRDRLKKISQLNNAQLCALLDLPEITPVVRQKLSQIESNVQLAIAARGKLLKTCDQTQKIKMIVKVKTVVAVVAKVFNALALIFCACSFFTSNPLLHLTVITSLVSAALLSSAIEQTLLSIIEKKHRSVISAKNKIDTIDQRSCSLLKMLENLPNRIKKAHLLDFMGLNIPASQGKSLKVKSVKQSNTGSVMSAVVMNSRNEPNVLSDTASQLENIAPEKVFILKIAKTMGLPRAPALHNLGPLPIKIYHFRALLERYHLSLKNTALGPITQCIIKGTHKASKSFPKRKSQCQVVELNDSKNSTMNAQKMSRIGQMPFEREARSTSKKFYSVNLCFGVINLVAMSIFGLYCFDQYANRFEFRDFFPT